MIVLSIRLVANIFPGNIDFNSPNSIDIYIVILHLVFHEGSFTSV